MKVTLSIAASPLAGSHLITAICSPENQVTSVRFYIDSVLKSPTDTSAPFTYLWDTTTVPDGIHFVEARASFERSRTAQDKDQVTVKNVPEPPPPPPPPQNVPVNVSVPVLDDTTPQEGQTIYVGEGTWTNSPTSYSYQWLRCDGAGANCVLSPGSTNHWAYTCSAADVGLTLRCSVTALNGVGPSQPAPTAQTTAVSALAAAVPTIISAPSISGTPVQGSTLSVSDGNWTNSPTSYEKQWKRCEPSIITSSVNDGDTIVNGQVWTVTTIPDVDLVEFFADGVLIGSSTAEPHTETISLSAGARNLGLKTTTNGVPTIHSDSGVVGRFAAVTVSAGPAVYTGAGDVIPGATGSSYSMVAADVGKAIRCLVKAVNATGDSIPVQSEATAAVTSSAPPPAPPNAYWNELWESGVVPPNWLTERSLFGNGDLAKITWAFVADPLGVKGTVLRLKCAYDSTKTQVSDGNYPDGARQLVALYRGAGQSRSGYQTISEETWYRVMVMFPSGNVFADGASNMIIEWHTDSNTQGQGGNSSSLFGGYAYPLTANGTTTPSGFVLRWNSGNPASPTATYWPSADGSGSYNARAAMPYQMNRWYDHKFRVIWSTNPSIGRLEWYVDGVQKVARSMATQYTNPSLFNSQSYHTFGMYNYRYNVTGDSSFYFDRVSAGPTLASIGG